MPEIVDLEVSRKNILSRVKGRRIRKVEAEAKVIRNTTPEVLKQELEGCALDDIHRKGKMLEFRFGGSSLFMHLMLHGDFCWSDDGKHKNVVLEIAFENDTSVLVKDWSRWMKVELNDPRQDIISELAETEVGIDPLDEGLTLDYIREILNIKSRSGIKTVLLDQTFISGIGNAYSDEILFDCKIHPSSKCSEILKGSADSALHDSIKKVIRWGIDEVQARAGGKSISEQDRDFMKVYRKSGQKCPRCGYMIACLKIASRDTFVCEKCQKKY